jgi:16S rRNA (adenine1518-N6/adenine1519-N6)-dimethyltransferase
MNIRKTIADKNIEPKKQLDQFFLHNEDILNKEIELAELKRDDIVLEIGAGPGNLTEKIAEKSRVIAVEIDKRFIPLLDRIENTTVICKDATEAVKDLYFDKIISNIPYSISKKLILELLKKKWKRAVLVVQKEFAEKMLGSSKLSLLVEDCADLEVIEHISADDFYPPAVESSLIVLHQKKLMDEKFWLFLIELFRHKNKDLKNVIKNCPENLARKKPQQLSLKEARYIYKLNK